MPTYDVLLMRRVGDLALPWIASSLTLLATPPSKPAPIAPSEA